MLQAGGERDTMPEAEDAVEGKPFGDMLQAMKPKRQDGDGGDELFDVHQDPIDEAHQIDRELIHLGHPEVTIPIGL